MAVEVIGDSARGDEYAFARLVVDGERILDADAPGMARPLAGLTLLEAAAVPGEVLAADATANAIAASFSASARAGRVAVAMSGGVDSAVALHRAERTPSGSRCGSGSTPPPGALSGRVAPRAPSSGPARPATRSASPT